MLSEKIKIDLVYIIKYLDIKGILEKNYNKPFIPCIMLHNCHGVFYYHLHPPTWDYGSSTLLLDNLVKALTKNKEFNDLDFRR